VRELLEGEVLEMLAGPIEQTFPDMQRAKLEAVKDNAKGWVTLVDKDQVTLVGLTKKYYICKASVAITNSEDVKASKVVRKLEKDELFEAATGELKADTKSGIFRVHGKASSDGVEGWVTVKGNAGTIFLDLVPKKYTVDKESIMYKNDKENPTGVLRKLEVGEHLTLISDIMTVKVEDMERIKVRAVNDNAVGWITKRAEAVKSWSPTYKITIPTAVQDTRAVTDSTKTLRDLSKGEMLEYLEGPVEEGKTMRLKGRTKKDGIIGWVTFRGEDGKRTMDN